jgi:hypothetical protein
MPALIHDFSDENIALLRAVNHTCCAGRPSRTSANSFNDIACRLTTLRGHPATDVEPEEPTATIARQRDRRCHIMRSSRRPQNHLCSSRLRAHREG